MSVIIDDNKWSNNSKNVKTPLNISKTPEEAYQEYKDLFLNTELSVRDIYIKIGVPQTQNTHYFYIRQHAEKDGLNGYSRRLKLKHGGRPKGSKNLKTLTGADKEEHDQYFEECYQEFMEYYKDETLSVQDILKKMGTHHKSNMYFYFRQRMNEDGLNPQKRKGKVSGKKIKETYEKRRKENESSYEECYQEYKKLFNETTLNMTEIYDELNIESRSSCAKYCRRRAKEEGLNAHKRAKQIFGGTHVISEEEKKIREILYVEYKKLFLETDMSIQEIHKKLGIENESSSRAKYLREKAKSEGLDGRTRMNKIRRKYVDLGNDEDGEELYQNYKKLFQDTELKISEIYERIHVKRNSPMYKYITKRCKEDGLDGRERMLYIRNKNRKISTSPVNKGAYRRQRKYSNETVKQVENSMGTLEKLFKQRNIKESTQKGYIACVYHWFNFIGDKYGNLQINIDYYISEEDKRIPMRERTIKKDLLEFREYLINCESMNTKKSIMSYYSKLTSIFRHFSIEIPVLPQVKMDKGYVSNYNDLPTHDMIRTACEQSSDDLKAVFLFMSSSGSAKAETLSITVRMFMEGCSEYLNEYPTSKNLESCLKELENRHDIIPLIYLRRLKTDKWYYTCCSPEASYMIIKCLNSRDNLKWDDKLFPLTSSLLLTRFQEINDKNGWGYVGGYRRFRSHALRKFMASNIGLPRDQVDSFQGRSKDMIAEAYFKQDPRQLKKIYLGAMERVMIYDNWGYDISNGVIETSVEQKTIESEVITKPVIENETPESKTQTEDNKHSIADELLKYADLLEKGLISRVEFDIIKEKLLGGIL